jgi:hypothetical protein
MSDPREEINRLIEIAERNAYQAGWRAAIDAMAKSAEMLRTGAGTAPVTAPALEPPAGPTQQPRRSGRPPSPTAQVVEECIKAQPGMTGVEVVKAAQSVDAKIKERTVRTCLRRLRVAKKIWKRNGSWFARTTSASNGNGGEHPTQARIEFLDERA